MRLRVMLHVRILHLYGLKWPVEWGVKDCEGWIISLRMCSVESCTAAPSLIKAVSWVNVALLFVSLVERRRRRRRKIWIHYFFSNAGSFKTTGAVEVDKTSQVKVHLLTCPGAFDHMSSFGRLCFRYMLEMCHVSIQLFSDVHWSPDVFLKMAQLVFCPPLAKNHILLFNVSLELACDSKTLAHVTSLTLQCFTFDSWTSIRHISCQ